eukprot:5750558-Prymnesium_polylepis.1
MQPSQTSPLSARACVTASAGGGSLVTLRAVAEMVIWTCHIGGGEGGWWRVVCARAKRRK